MTKENEEMRSNLPAAAAGAVNRFIAEKELVYSGCALTRSCPVLPRTSDRIGGVAQPQKRGWNGKANVTVIYSGGTLAG